MSGPASLRLRLTAIILGPLMAIAVLVGLWQWRDARDQAADLFDRSLLTTALAVAADVARTGGNAISLETRDLLSDTSGGPVYYHAYAPNGYYVTGFATPPVRPPEAVHADDQPYIFYNSTYHGRAVRALRLLDVTTVDGISGTFTYTVWQDIEVREALLRTFALRAFIVMSVLIGTVALVVWFGVRLGLRPLTDLEDAISRRSSDDLSPIRRAVPPETRGLVERLNTLFRQVEGTMAAQASFISNAAHQLRNPIAGVLAMAEAVRSAPTLPAARSRTDELLRSARHVKDLANKLLALERASASEPRDEPMDLSALLTDIARDHTAAARARGVTLQTELPDGQVILRADPVMLREALANLVDNALTHGGPGLTRVVLSLSVADGAALIGITDDGKGIAKGDEAMALARFGQADPSQGSGLGLSIAQTVALGLGGSLDLDGGDGGGLSVRLSLPGASVADRPATGTAGARPAA